MKPESGYSRAFRLGANMVPLYRATGARVVHISSCFQQVRVNLNRNRRTANHLGYIWGGSLYAATDPVYALMLQLILGARFVVVDRAAEIEFLRPAEGPITIDFIIREHELSAIRQNLETEPKLQWEFGAQWTDHAGEVVYARVKKRVHVGPRHERHRFRWRSASTLASFWDWLCRPSIQ